MARVKETSGHDRTLVEQVRDGVVHDRRKLLLCPDHFSTEGRILDLDACRQKASFRDWTERDLRHWTQDEYQGAPGVWKVQDGALWNQVGPKDGASQASILWYKKKLSSPNHCLRIVAAAMPVDDERPVSSAEQIAEINMIWNGNGRTGGPRWKATIGSFFGWYVGFNGMEYLYGRGDVTQSHGKYVTRTTRLNVARNYEIVAGYYKARRTKKELEPRGVDFLFIDGMPVMQNEPPARFGVVNEPMVALEGFSNAYLPSRLRFQEVEIFEIPYKAVRPIDLRPHADEERQALAQRGLDLAGADEQPDGGSD